MNKQDPVFGGAVRIVIGTLVLGLAFALTDFPEQIKPLVAVVLTLVGSGVVMSGWDKLQD